MICRLLQTATHLQISDKWRCIKWTITNFSGCTPVRPSPPRYTNALCSKPPRKHSYYTTVRWPCTFLLCLFAKL